jgi:hypothetical protein
VQPLSRRTDDILVSLLGRLLTQSVTVNWPRRTSLQGYKRFRRHVHLPLYECPGDHSQGIIEVGVGRIAVQLHTDLQRGTRRTLDAASSPDPMRDLFAPTADASGSCVLLACSMPLACGSF